MEVTRNLPDDVVQIDLYKSLLARLLTDMRNLLGEDDLLPEDDDDDWLQERTFALDLKANAEAGILRGLLEDDTNWAHLIAAGYWLTALTHALIIRTLENAETRNRVNIQSISHDGETQAWVRDCRQGCPAEDVTCRARADTIMSIAEAKRQRLAHPFCTLLITSLAGRPL